MLSGSSQALPRHHNRQLIGADHELPEPVGYSALLNAQTHCLTGYLTKALHLTHWQRAAVRRIAHEQMQQLLLQNTSDLTVLPLDDIMLQVLNPEQYSLFQRLPSYAWVVRPASTFENQVAKH